MVGRQYTIPPDAGISPQCEDLLSRMLLPEPQKRITVREIMQHSWYLNNLPPEAAAMNEKYLNAAPSPGKLPPEGIRRLVQEAHLSNMQCRIDTKLAPSQQAQVVMQLVAADQRSQQQQMPPSVQQQLQQLLQDQQLAPEVQRQLQQLIQQQQVTPPSGAPAALQYPVLLPQSQQLQHLQQCVQPQLVPLQEQCLMAPQLQQQHEQLGLCHSRQVDEDTLMMIDSAISDQLGAGSSDASTRLQTYIRSAQPK